MLPHTLVYYPVLRKSMFISCQSSRLVLPVSFPSWPELLFFFPMSLLPAFFFSARVLQMSPVVTIQSFVCYVTTSIPYPYPIVFFSLSLQTLLSAQFPSNDYVIIPTVSSLRSPPGLPLVSLRSLASLPLVSHMSASRMSPVGLSHVSCRSLTCLLSVSHMSPVGLSHVSCRPLADRS